MSFAANGCLCPCHGSRGTPGDGYSHLWRDDRDIMHEDWMNCLCGCPSAADIDAAKTERGGWTRAQLAEWGVSWPPPQGWKARLLQTGVST